MGYNIREQNGSGCFFRSKTHYRTRSRVWFWIFIETEPDPVDQKTNQLDMTGSDWVGFQFNRFFSVLPRSNQVNILKAHLQFYIHLSRASRLMPTKLASNTQELFLMYPHNFFKSIYHVYNSAKAGSKVTHALLFR